MGPTPEFYTQAGHVALVLRQGEEEGLAYDWGLFNEKTPGFFKDFLKGTAQYSMGRRIMLRNYDFYYEIISVDLCCCFCGKNILLL